MGKNGPRVRSSRCLSEANLGAHGRDPRCWRKGTETQKGVNGMPNGRLAVVLGVVSLVLLLLVADLALAAIPKKVNYQARLTDTDTGEPITGTHSMTFRIYTTSTGGSAAWSETKSVTADANGVIATVLGSTTPITMSFDGSMWLEIVVDSETLSPRREIVAVPYAFRAVNADSLGGLNSSAYSLAGHTHDDRYYTESELSSGGIINTPSNPMDWTKLKSVPAGFADGVDDAGGGTGDGYSLDAADGSPTDALYVDNDGDVGIGTTNPAAQLEIWGDSNINAELRSIRIGGATAVFGGEQDAGVVGTYSNHPLAFQTQLQERMRIATDGSVGIGITNPTEVLQVAGTIQSTTGGFKFPDGTTQTTASAAKGYALDAADGTPANAVYVDNEGNVGIGTTTPLSTIAVTGDAEVSGSSTGGLLRSYNDNPSGTGTGIVGSGNNLGYGYYLTGGSGVAGTGTMCGVYGYATLNSSNGGQAALSGGIGTGDFAKVCFRGVNGTQYKIMGTGITATVMATSKGRVALACPESPEAWIEDFGSGKVAAGMCHVDLDQMFLDCVTVDDSNPLKVFVQPTSPAMSDFYVAKGQTGFDVILTGDNAGDVTATFDYRVVGKWRGYESFRFERVEEQMPVTKQPVLERSIGER
jgi:hypothetical protein